jgi:hypothetical protein
MRKSTNHVRPGLINDLSVRPKLGPTCVVSDRLNTYGTRKPANLTQKNDFEKVFFMALELPEGINYYSEIKSGSYRVRAMAEYDHGLRSSVQQYSVFCLFQGQPG